MSRYIDTCHCHMCTTSGVCVDRTTLCGKSIGIECGCDEIYTGNTCDDSDCKECLIGTEAKNGTN